MLFSDLEQLVRNAMAPADADSDRSEVATAPETEVTTKLAEALESVDAGNSRLGVAMLLMAIDILSD